LIAGAALEIILTRTLDPLVADEQKRMLNLRELNYALAFKTVLDDLLTLQNRKTMAEYINLEKEVYQQNGLVTYYAEKVLLDIFTDTTERSPTFMTPPFKRFDDLLSPAPWAFVKDPLRATPDAWEHVLGRSPRCLEWDSALYREMGVPANLASAPPELDKNEILKFFIGKEDDPSRVSRNPNMAVSIVTTRDLVDPAYRDYQKAFQQCSSTFQQRFTLFLGEDAPADYPVVCPSPVSALNLLEHLAVKLVLNTISTGTMVLLGRVTGNWMSWVEVSNKKLRDRAIRLIAELCEVSYREACYALHETLNDSEYLAEANKIPQSPAQYTISKLQNR
jgi:N-acetylmuramic acid 6-phosphate etherase